MLIKKHLVSAVLACREHRLVWAMLYAALCLISSTSTLEAQTILSADGVTDTYQLINQTLAPEGTAVETPDCAHEEFGPHIDQVMDEDLEAYVFRFHIHVDEDNDRCKNYDRQRNEIKTYDKSPEELLATEGEWVEYRWKFKLDDGFQTSASFTHLHQIKAVGGSEEGMPLITLTARSTHKFQIRYAEYATQETIYEGDLQALLGRWLQVTERIHFGENGSYHIDIVALSDGATLLTYSNDHLRMWKTDAAFLRPKWGIYRSLNHWEDLRDEILFFNDFSIEELNSTDVHTTSTSVRDFRLQPNPTSGTFSIIADGKADMNIFDCSGRTLVNVQDVPMDHLFDFGLSQGRYWVCLSSDGGVKSRQLLVR